MVDQHDIQDAILAHLRELAIVKKAMLQTAITVAEEFPGEGAVLLRAIKALTVSANNLLGDTAVTEAPKG